MATFKDYYELTKPRLSFLSVFTALVAYWMAPKTVLYAASFPYFIALVLGVALCAAGAAVLNQWMEFSADALMERTKNRPIPQKHILPKQALIFGVILSLGGLFVLVLNTTLLSTGLAFLTIASYLWLYTPLKKISPINTLVGAIPGALPVLIGWSAATSSLETLGWLLFALLFFWQMPHFYALAWLYKEDYASAGFHMLSRDDADGSQVAQKSFVYGLILFIVSLLPSFLGFASGLYLTVACLLNLFLLLKAYHFLSNRKETGDRKQAAQKLFLATLLYLPLILGILLLDHLFLGF